ncbi:hypothetical protein OAO87_00515 [bacterium]|nr:hypothetical protein [bacterium]
MSKGADDCLIGGWALRGRGGQVARVRLFDASSISLSSLLPISVREVGPRPCRSGPYERWLLHLACLRKR